MSLFQSPPPIPGGSQGPVSHTPPIPHVPIGTQGDQPPRRQVQAVLAMVAVLASWPQDLEPRLQRPNDQQQKLAPLTLTYGQQPPRSSVAGLMARTVSAWPPDLEPRYDYTNDQQRDILPLLLTYGQQPTPCSPLSTTNLVQILNAWPADVGPVLTWPNWLPRTSCVLTTFPAVSQPPPTPKPITVGLLTQIVASWPVDVGPLVPWPDWVQQHIVPLTLPYGSQPPPRAFSTPPSTVLAWTDTWDAQTAPKSAAWNIPPLGKIPFVPRPQVLWTAWDPPWVAPPAPVTIAPLTLPRGTQVPGPPLASPVLFTIVGSWPQTWDRPQTLVDIAPLTLPYGSQPVPRSGLDRQLLASAAWIVDAPLPVSPIPTAAWNVPLAAPVPYTPLPALIWAAWAPDPGLLVVPVTIAPLAGTQPLPPPVPPPVAQTGGGGIVHVKDWRWLKAAAPLIPQPVPPAPPPLPHVDTTPPPSVASQPPDPRFTWQWMAGQRVAPTTPAAPPKPVAKPVHRDGEDEWVLGLVDREDLDK